jgi:small conductance mechanosensitive channel
VVRRSLEKGNVDRGVIQFTASLLKGVLYTLLLFNISVSLGVQASSIAALLGTAGVTVGLALQGGLANIAGGVILLLFKPFQVGDYIVCNTENGTEGTVTKIDICYTTLLSIDNKNILVPNGTLSNTTITNVTARDQRRLDVKVGISYDSDLRKAKAILERLLLEDEDTQSDAEMVVFVDSLGESSVILGFRVWVPTERYWSTKWRMNEKIKETFDAEGIRIPYPQIDVHLRQKTGNRRRDPGKISRKES